MAFEKAQEITQQFIQPEIQTLNALSSALAATKSEAARVLDLMNSMYEMVDGVEQLKTWYAANLTSSEKTFVATMRTAIPQIIAQGNSLA